MNIDMSTNASLAQRLRTVQMELDVVATPEDVNEDRALPTTAALGEETDRPHRWQRVAVIATSAEVRAVAIDLARLAVLPTAAGYAVVHAGRRATRIVAPDHATNLPHSIPVAAHDFVVAGRELLAGIVDSGVPLTLLVVLIVFSAMRGLLSSHAPVIAGVWWSARAVMPPFFFLVTVSIGAHLVVPQWLVATPILAYLTYVAMIEAPLIRRAVRARRSTSEAQR